jgi:hypothetical protein
MADFYAAHRMKENVSSKLLRKKGIVGVGVGFADPKQPAKGAAVIVYTGKKVPKAAVLAALANVPASIKANIPIRHIPSGKAVTLAHLPKPRVKQFTGRIRPVQPGYSVSGGGGTGTGGLVVINSPQANQLYLLSNRHVLVSLENPTQFTPVLQPGTADGGTLPNDRIGRLERFVPLRLNNRNNYVDAALALPLRNNLLNPSYPTVGSLPGHVNNYRVGDRFIKVGRTTGLTTGVVESIDTDIIVLQGLFGPPATFRNQTIVASVNRNPVAEPGDSGSVFLAQSNHFVTAVLYGGMGIGERAIAFPFGWAAEVFNIRVASTGSSLGKVKEKTGKRDYACVRSLTKKELASIRVASPRS